MMMDEEEDVMASGAGKRQQQPQFRKKKKMAVGAPASSSTHHTHADMQEEDEAAPHTVSKQSTKAPAKAPLSFAEEDGEDGTEQVAVVKKKTAHTESLFKDKKTRAALKAELPKPDTLRTGGYTSDYLSELRKSQRQAPPRLDSGVRLEEVPTWEDGAPEDVGAAQETEIPTAEAIKRAKEKRKQAREMGEYIPLEENGNGAGGAGKSRLLREGDSGDEEDGLGDEKMSFGEAARRQTSVDTRRNVKEALEVVDGSDAEEGDEEIRRWESQTIKSGRAAVLTKHETNPRKPKRQGSLVTASQPIKNIVPPTTISLTDLRKKLRDTLISLKEVHTSHVNNVANMKEDMASSEQQIPKLEKDLEEASGRYSFFQETRGYIRDLLSCLAEKVPETEQVESRMHVLWKVTADDLVARRRQDSLDEEFEFSRALGLPLPDVSYEPHARHERMTQRSARLKKRMEDMGGHGGEDGTVSDNELDAAEQQKYDDGRSDILEDAASVFENVADEFAELSHIAKRFEEWKLRYPEEYEEAYISTTLRKILQPLINFQLLEWNPLNPRTPEFEDMPWFTSLMFYGFKDGVEPPETDPDSLLVPELVEATVLPKLAGILEFVYDPLSTSQTLRMSSLISRLVSDYPTVGPDREKTQTLFAAVAARLRRAFAPTETSAEVSIPLYPQEFRDERPDAQALCDARVRSVLKAIRNCFYWQGVLKTSIIQEIVIGSLILKILLPYLQINQNIVDNISVLEEFTSMIPHDAWYGGGAASMSTSMALEPLTDYIRGIFQTLSQSPNAGEYVERVRAILARLEVKV